MRCSGTRKVECKEPCTWIIGKGCRKNIPSLIPRSLDKPKRKCSGTRKADCKEPCTWITGKGCRKNIIDLYSELIKTPSKYSSLSEIKIPSNVSEVKEHVPIKLGIWIRKAMSFIIEKHRSKGAILSDYSIMCLQDDVTPLIFNYYNKKVFHNNNLCLNYWKNLMKDTDVKIIFIYFSIQDSKMVGHANWIIVDKVRKIVELFDPHGNIHHGSNPSPFWGIDYRKWVEKYFQLDKKYKFIPSTYKIVSYDTSCPKMGFQIIENLGEKKEIDPGGFCQLWSMFLMDLRLSNLSWDMKYIQGYYIRMNKQIDKNLGDLFKEFIRNYSLYYQNKFG